MEFRQTTEADIDFCAEHGISGGKFGEKGEEIAHSVTLEHNGQVLAIGGILKITDCTAWAYVELTKYAMDHIYTVYRVVRDWIEIVCKEHGIIRLQAWVETGYQEREVFAEHLKFNNEAFMRDFIGKGKPAYLYVRYFEV